MQLIAFDCIRIRCYINSNATSINLLNKFEFVLTQKYLLLIMDIRLKHISNVLQHVFTRMKHIDKKYNLNTSIYQMFAAINFLTCASQIEIFRDCEFANSNRKYLLTQTKQREIESNRIESN